jgi:transposase
MLDHSTRQAILRLREQGHGSRAIAHALGISRGAVRGVLDSQIPLVPQQKRTEKAEPFRQDILTLYASCKGNLVRVHQELLARGADISYQGLTAFCRRHGIGYEPPKPAGDYHFEPAQEMQHDTSPHDVKFGGKIRRLQVASVVLCYSRLLFAQYYPTFNRFLCKVFLTDALRYFGGAAATCMIDNTHVVVLHGTGKDMVPVPEMAAFAERFSFKFAAHEKGDANRSARVERPFHFIENNFLAGREFSDWDDLNGRLLSWCDTVNAEFNKRWHASRRELFAAELPALKPLPVWVPEVYTLHQRHVDLQGYVNVHINRYSAPYQLIGRQLEVRETKDRIDIYDGPRLVASHKKIIDPLGLRVTDPAHRPPWGEGQKARAACPAELTELLRLAPEITDYINALHQQRSLLALRRLLRLVREYPRQPLVAAVSTAAAFGLYDIYRLERMVLRQCASDYFPAPFDFDPHDPEDPEDDHHE